MLEEQNKKGHAYTEGKGQLGRRGWGWYDNIKMGVKGRRWELVNRINLAQDTHQRPSAVNTVGIY